MKAECMHGLKHVLNRDQATICYYTDLGFQIWIVLIISNDLWYIMNFEYIHVQL